MCSLNRGTLKSRCVRVCACVQTRLSRMSDSLNNSTVCRLCEITWGAQGCAGASEGSWPLTYLELFSLRCP